MTAGDDTTAAEWTVEDLHQLRDDTGEPGTELVLVHDETQDAWDQQRDSWRRKAEVAAAYFHANVDDLPGDLLIRNALAFLGYPRAAAEAMGPHGTPLYAATAAAGQPKPVAAKRRPPARRKRAAKVIEPSAVHPPRRRGGAS